MCSVLAGVVVCAAGSGCSALVDPDTGLLGDESAATDAQVPAADGGTSDGFVVDDEDSGPAPDMPVAPDCPAPPRCEGDALVVCEGERAVSQLCPDGCDAAAGRCIEGPARFTPSNVGADLFRDEAPDVDVVENIRFDTGSCSSMSDAARIVGMRAGGEACVLSVGSFRVRSDAFLQVVGSRPLIVIASDEIRIEGLIDLSARDTESGPAGFDGPTMETDGEGAGAGGGGVHEGSFDDGGGGGAGGCGAGGMGGTGGTGAGGSAGAGWLAGSDLQPLVGGSSGGRGRGAVALGNAGPGGGGGGALQLTARTRLILDGGILSGGGGGGAGRSEGDRSSNWGSGGGGGAGGNVLLESPEITVDGGGVSIVGGGGGGSASGNSAGEPGQDGIDAALERPAGGAAGGNQYGASGGDGAGQASMSGDDGATNTAAFANGGGGGGGSGCLVVRTMGDLSVPLNPDAAQRTLPLLP